MASDGGDCPGRMAHRIAAARQANDRICMLQFEQRIVGYMGILCRGVCINRSASLSFPHEPSRAPKKLEGKEKRAVSRLTVSIKILFEASDIHTQKNAFKEDQRVGVCVESPDNPKRITEDKSPKSDHPPIRLLRANEPGRGYRHYHGWPLQPIDVLHVHHSSRRVRSKRDAGIWLWIKTRQSQ